MDSIIYNILWIDDEHEKLSSLTRAATDFGLKLHPFKSLSGGMEELEKNYAKYDGVLIDAKFYEYEDDIAGTEETANSIAAKARIDQLKNKQFEIHVLTGQAEAFGDKMYNTFFKKVYRKGIDADEDALFNSLRESASKQKESQIRYQFNTVFKVCKTEYLGSSIESDLISIASPLITGTQDKFNIAHLNTIRKVIERMFKRFAELNLVPTEITENTGWVNGTSRFIANKHANYAHTKEYFHPFIAHSLHRLLDITQDGSHSEGNLTLGVDFYLKSSKNLYAINSCAYLLFEILEWVQLFIDENSNAQANFNLWEVKKTATSLDDLIGCIAQDSYNNYYCNQYILDYNYTKANFKVGEEIEITEITENFNDKNNKMYPKRGHKFKKV